MVMNELSDRDQIRGRRPTSARSEKIGDRPPSPHSVSVTQFVWLAVVVLVHLVITLTHGTAHAQAHVPLSLAANVFVFTVIVAGPLVGLGLTWLGQRIGTWLIGTTMAGAFLFGFVNHFVFYSPDHVAHIDPQWQPLFMTTAILLALTEGLGSALAFRSIWAGRLR
jgi:hypothetical protein